MSHKLESTFINIEYQTFMYVVLSGYTSKDYDYKLIENVRRNEEIIDKVYVNINDLAKMSIRLFKKHSSRYS